MKKLMVAAACAVALVSAMLAAAPSQASSSPPPLTWAQLNAMAPAQVAALQNPLIAAADPISKVGTTEMTSLYSSIALDTPNRAVDVYVTDTARAGQLLQAAKEKDPGLDLGRVRVMKSAYSLAALTSAADSLVSASAAGRTPFRIYAAVQVGNGQGLELRVPDPVAARDLASKPAAALGGKSVQQLGGVSLTFTRGVPTVPFSRQDDSAPFIGGDLSYGWNSADGYRPTCTTGIAVEDSSGSGHDGLVEAGHCFTPNNGVYTQNFGHFIGAPGSIVGSADAEIIWTGDYNGAGSNADEGESNKPGGGINYFPLVTLANPYNGEFVCQDGIESYNLGRGVPCNLKVGNSITYSRLMADGRTATVHGIIASSNNGNPVGAIGDSGAVVFIIWTSSTRAAVGMISSGPAGCDPNCTEIYLVQQAAIMGAFSVRLNPHT